MTGGTQEETDPAPAPWHPHVWGSPSSGDRAPVDETVPKRRAVCAVQNLIAPMCVK